MALAYRASGTFVAAAATTSGAIGLPAGLANGDILVLPIHSRGTGNTVTTPSGYSRAAEVNITSGHRLVVFYKYVTNAAGEVAPNVTHSTSDLIAGRLSAFSGGDATTQLDVAAVTDKHGDLATVTAKSITPVSAGTMAVWIFSSGDDNTLNAATQGTTAYSSDTTTGVDGSLALVYELQTNVAATGTCAMTQSANGPDNWNTVTLLLRPASVVAATPTAPLGFDSITYTLEMAFGASPFAPAPVWTDVSQHVRSGPGININRGRSSERSDTQSGTMSFTLDNRNRRFDPDNTAGPYFGQLLPQVRCRLRVRRSSVNYPIFDGYVQGWPQSYQYPSEAVVNVVAVDLFARLATRKLPVTFLQLVTLTDAPDVYFPFDEDPGTNVGTAVDVSGNGHTGGFQQLATIDSFIPGEQGRKAKQTLFEFAPFHLTPFYAQGTPLTLLRTMEFWFQCDDVDFSSTGIAPVFVLTGRSTNSTFELEISNNALFGPSVQLIVYDAAATALSIFSAFTTDVAAHVVATIDSAGSVLTLYWNGQVLNTASVSALTFEGGAGAGVADISTFGQANVRFGHLALYEETLSAAQILRHYSAGSSAGLRQTVSERMDAIVDYVGLSAAGLYNDTNLKANTYLSQANLSGTALAPLQNVMRTEQGRLFVDAAGVLQAQGRTADMKDLTVNATVQATLSDSGAYAYSEIPIDSNHVDLMRNSIYVSVGGATVRAVDEESVALFDELEESIATDLGDPTAAHNLGLSRIRRFGEPTSRINQIELRPAGIADVRYPLCFGVELGWRLTVTRTPQAVGSAISKTVTVEGITHSITAGQWITTLYLVPAQTVYTAQPWFVMGDATFGRFGAAAGNQLSY